MRVITHGDRCCSIGRVSNSSIASCDSYRAKALTARAKIRTISIMYASARSRAALSARSQPAAVNDVGGGENSERGECAIPVGDSGVSNISSSWSEPIIREPALGGAIPVRFWSDGFTRGCLPVLPCSRVLRLVGRLDVSEFRVRDNGCG